jgi:hypothetical protein
MNIEKIKPSRATVIALCIGLLCEVILAFFLLDLPFFLSLSVWQLVCISVGLTMPILLVGAIGMSKDMIPKPVGEQIEVNNLRVVLLSALLSILVFTICLLIAYYLKFNLKRFYTVFIISHVAFAILFFIVTKPRKA